MLNSAPSNYPKIGDLGEELVVKWLEHANWQTLHRRFACRWGEIDIITQYHESASPPILAFVEVKTRGVGNWDAGGRKAITPQKQAKLWQTATFFLSKYPHKANYICRFDVAIVSHQKMPTVSDEIIFVPDPKPVLIKLGYELKLQEYILAAFEQ